MGKSQVMMRDVKEAEKKLSAVKAKIKKYEDDTRIAIKTVWRHI